MALSGTVEEMRRGKSSGPSFGANAAVEEVYHALTVLRIALGVGDHDDGGAGGVELAEHFGGGGKQNIVSGPDSAVTQRLGDVAFSGARGTDQDGVMAVLMNLPLTSS